MTLRIFCTNCKPEFEMKPNPNKIQTHCPCSNVSVLWDINLAGKKDFVQTPFRVNSYDSRCYRIDKVE